MATRKEKTARLMTIAIVLGIIAAIGTGVMIAQSCYNFVPKGPIAIYEDSFTTGWNTFGSTNVTVTAQSSPGGQYDSYALQANFTDANATLELHRSGAVIDTTHNGYLSFRIRKETANNDLLVAFRTSDGAIGNFVSVGSYLIYGQRANFVPGQWYSVRIPLVDNACTLPVQSVVFQAGSPTTVYLDEIVMIDGLSLAFPLPYGDPDQQIPWTPYTARIASVFDHTMTKTYASDADPAVTAWTGESGYLNPGPDGTCKQQPSGLPFTLTLTGFFTGTYQGGGSLCGNTTYLSYNGHSGIDYAVEINTPVYATQNGMVIPGGVTSAGALVDDCPADGSSCVGIGDKYGRIRIQHANGYTSWYMHLARQAGGLTNGTYIQQGQLIGYSGQTSDPKYPVGPHLHFEVRTGTGFNDTPIDPYGWDGTSADPYHNYHQSVFNSRQWR